MEAEKLAQLVKYLPHKHKDPSLTPTTSVQKLGVALCACNLIAREMEMGNLEVRLTSRPNQISKLQVHRRPCPQNNVESDSRHPKSLQLIGILNSVLASRPAHYLSPIHIQKVYSCGHTQQESLGERATRQ